MSDTPARSSSAVDAGVFVAALILLFVSIANDWTAFAILSAVVLVGVMVTNAARRQMAGKNSPPRESPRPWKRDTE
jgi:hypothetical protein